MKNKLAIAGLVIVTAFVLASLPSAMATLQFPPLTVSEQGIVWTVDLLHPFDSGFSGKAAIDVKAYYYNDMIENPNYDPNGPIDPINNPPTIPDLHQLAILKYSKTDVQIKIWLDTNDANFVQHAENSYVTVTFATATGNVEKTFSGPGWAWGGIHE